MHHTRIATSPTTSITVATTAHRGGVEFADTGTTPPGPSAFDDLVDGCSFALLPEACPVSAATISAAAVSCQLRLGCSAPSHEEEQTPFAFIVSGLVTPSQHTSTPIAELLGIGRSRASSLNGAASFRIASPCANGADLFSEFLHEQPVVSNISTTQLLPAVAILTPEPPSPEPNFLTADTCQPIVRSDDDSPHVSSTHHLRWSPNAFAPKVDPVHVGRGRFGTVSAVHNPDFTSTIAVKTVDGSADPESAAAELAFVIRAFASAATDPRVWTNVVEVLEAEVDDQFAVLAMEFLPGGTLNDHAAFRLPSRGAALPSGQLHPAVGAQSRTERLAVEVRLRRLANDLCFALHTCERSLRVIHRDLKPANVLLAADGTAKLADFGVSAVLADDVDIATDFKGSIMYMSPERLRGEAHRCNSDVWSLGVVLLQLANGGEHPFEPPAWHGGGDAFWRLAAVLRHTDSATTCAAATAAAVDVALARAGLSPLFADFVRHCLVTDGAERVTATQLLLHDWLLRDP